MGRRIPSGSPRTLQGTTFRKLGRRYHVVRPPKENRDTSAFCVPVKVARQVFNLVKTYPEAFIGRRSFTSSPCWQSQLLVGWYRKRTNVSGASCSFAVPLRQSARTPVPSAGYPPSSPIVYDRYARWDPLPGTTTLSSVPAFTEFFIKRPLDLSNFR